jgi:hypothetical protein
VLLELFHELCRVQVLRKDLQTLLDTRVAAVEVSSLLRGSGQVVVRLIEMWRDGGTGLETGHGLRKSTNSERINYSSPPYTSFLSSGGSKFSLARNSSNILGDKESSKKALYGVNYN